MTMIGRLSAIFGLFMLGAAAQAEAPACAKSEAACLLDAAWSAALVLSDEKRDRLAPAFLEIAALSREPELITFWERRFDQSSQAFPTYPDYGWLKAEPILSRSGVDGLIEIARSRQAPLSFGRSDALMSAGIHLRKSDPVAAEKLNQALIDIARNASAFERPNLANAGAELAMARCDRAMLTTAVTMTDAPNNLRYAFWKARIDGGSQGLLERVRRIDNDQDTRDVRRVLDGYRAILELGYCDQTAPAIGG